MRELVKAALVAVWLPLGALAQQAGPPPMPVKAEAVKLDTVVEAISAIGTLRADEVVMVRPEIAGRVQTIHFKEGQAVEAGAPLVSLDPAEYKAQLAGSQAEVTVSELVWERQRNLDRQKLTSQQDLDNARARLDAARAKLALDQVRLDKAVLRAPFAGIVGLRAVSPGAYVSPGQDIAGLASIKTMKLDFRVPEVYLARLAPGQSLAVQVDAYPGQRFDGAIAALDPILDEETRTVLVRARLPNPDEKLRPGMFGRVSLQLAAHANAVVVPEQAIVPQGDKAFVFKVVEGKAKLTAVKLGVRRAGDVEVLEGLAAGDTVVTDGQLKIRDGAPVSVLGAAPAKQGA